MRTTISAALAIMACVTAGAAFACEDEAVTDDSIAFAKSNASQKPVVLAVDSRRSVADRASVSTKKTTSKADTAVAPRKSAMKRAAMECAGSDC